MVKNWLLLYFNSMPVSLHPVIVFDWPNSANKRMLIPSNAKFCQQECRFALRLPQLDTKCTSPAKPR
jgi:hypothetical protein